MIGSMYLGCDVCWAWFAFGRRVRRWRVGHAEGEAGSERDANTRWLGHDAHGCATCSTSRKKTPCAFYILPKWSLCSTLKTPTQFRTSTRSMTRKRTTQVAAPGAENAKKRAAKRHTHTRALTRGPPDVRSHRESAASSMRDHHGRTRWYLWPGCAHRRSGVVRGAAPAHA